jgi:uncharacterized membrane protein YhaH (DUF805 family)
MGPISIWHWVLFIAIIWLAAANWISIVRILHRAGYSGWWSLLAFIPIVNVIALWYFAKARWPALAPAVSSP